MDVNMNRADHGMHTNFIIHGQIYSPQSGRLADILKQTEVFVVKLFQAPLRSMNGSSQVDGYHAAGSANACGNFCYDFPRHESPNDKSPSIMHYRNQGVRRLIYAMTYSG